MVVNSTETTMSSRFTIPDNPDRDCLLNIHRLLTLRIDQLRNVDMGSSQLQEILFQFEALTAEPIRLVEEVAVRLATDAH